MKMTQDLIKDSGRDKQAKVFDKQVIRLVSRLCSDVNMLCKSNALRISTWII